MQWRNAMTLPDYAAEEKPLVLVVDDDHLLRAILRETLEEGGYAVDEADCGLRALEKVRETPPDLIMLDIVMPGMDGFATCTELRRIPAARHLPVLMATALEDPETINRAYAAGATDYLIKPINWKQLQHHVRYLLRAHRIAEELRRKEERLAHAQRIAGVGDWEWDGRSADLRCSEEALRILALPAQESKVPMATFLQRIHPDDRATVIRLYAKLADEGTAFHVDYRLVLPDGTVRTVNGQGEAVVEDTGKGRRLAGTIQDITERKSLEETLLLSAKFFENSSEMILIADAGGAVIDVNPAFCRLTGHRREDLLGQLLENGAIHRDLHMFRNAWKAVQRSGHWRGEFWSRRANGESFPALVTIDAVRNRSGDIGHYLWTATDISRLKETEQRLQHLAQHDPLTDLPNRLLLYDRLRQALIPAGRRSGMVAVLAFDINRFQEINDTLGHCAGDEVLKSVAQRVQTCIRKSDTVARLGSDEFAIILSDLMQIDNGAMVAQRIQDLLAAPFLIDGKEFFLTVSTGIALYPDDAADAETLVGNAEAAMQFAKRQGPNHYQFFSETMNARAQERLALKTDLRRGLDRNEFFLHYQPKFDSQSGALTGLEALARWDHPERGLVPPLQFIPMAEETGLIYPLGEQVLRLACTQNRAWQEQGYLPFRVAVNLSAHQFREIGLVNTVSRILAETGLGPEWLELEITESAIMQDTDRAIGILKSLREMGIRIALDDFGTGYSSLSYLRRFPIDALKIDYSFIQNMFRNREDAAIVRAIIAMAHSLKLKVIAEGVETEEQRVFLREQECDEIQGYLARMPQPVAEVERLLPRSGTDKNESHRSPGRGHRAEVVNLKR